MVVGTRSIAVFGTLVVVSLLAMLLVPGAVAVPEPATVRVGRLLADCHATFELVPLKTRLFFDEAASVPAQGFLAGSKLTLQRGEGDDTHVRRAAIGSGNLYSHYQTQIVETREFGPFKGDLAQYFEGSTLTIMPHGTVDAIVDLGTPMGFEVAARVPVDVRNADPRDAYNSDPGAPRLAAAIADLRMTGNFTILIEQTGFMVASEGKMESFVAEDSYTINSEVAAKKVHYYILRVQNGVLRIEQPPVAAQVFSDAMDIRCDGAIYDGGASDRIDGIGNARRIASGLLTVQPKLAAEDQIDVRFTVEERPSTPVASTNVGVARSAFPYWGLVAAFGFVALGGGATAWKFSRKPVPDAEPLPTEHSAPAVTPLIPRAIPDMEAAYRQDPSNMVVALELGLAYTKNKQPNDALPLLQLAIHEHPKMDAARYFAGIALLEIGRIDDGLRHLAYSFRLNALNVARFINEGDALAHGHHPRVRAMLARWSRQFQESNARGYV